MDDGREYGTWPDAVTAERLLHVVAAGDRPADTGVLREAADARVRTLLRLLTAASGDAEIDPGREQAALAAFRAARRAGGARQGRRLVVSGRSVKVLAGGLAAVFAVSGVAVAAGTGVLPGPFRGGAFHAGPLTAGGAAGSGEGPSAGPETEPAATLPPAPAPSPTADGPGSPGHHHGDPHTPHHFGVPKPSDRTHKAAVRALCRSYTEAVRHGGHADPRLVVRLQREAGRKDRIAAYCRRLLTHGQEGANRPANLAASAPPVTPRPTAPEPTTPSSPTASPSTLPTPTTTSTTSAATSPTPTTTRHGQGKDKGGGEKTTHGSATTVK
jgi:hypothetical protein